MFCKCRTCGKKYDDQKSRADLQGYCSAKCQHEKARRLGWKKSRRESEYDVLNSRDQIGPIPWTDFPAILGTSITGSLILEDDEDNVDKD